MDEIKINMIEKTDEGLVLKLPTTSVEQVKGLKSKLEEKVDNSDLISFKEENKIELNKKVDKVSGKGLSTNDYTDLEKAEVAKIKNLATNETVTGIKSDVENLKTSKVDKVSGKGLSTNDYDNTEKAEVAKIKNKADKTYVDTELADKATVTDLTKKIDKTSITSDLEGIDETKVLSQKAGSLLEDAIKNIDLSGKIDKSSITDDFNGTDIAKVLSQKGANDLLKLIPSNNGRIEYTTLQGYLFAKLTIGSEKLCFVFNPSPYPIDSATIPVGFRPTSRVTLGYNNPKGTRGKSFVVFDADGKMYTSQHNEGQDCPSAFGMYKVN